jgi:hypothetical protein
MLLEKNEIIFDSKKSLSALYLWLLFGFLSTMVSCDLQKWMVKNTIFRHVIGIIAFFFLFTVLETPGNISVEKIWTKTITIYFVYIIITKSRWQFALPVLILLVIDQTIAVHIRYIKSNKENVNIDDNIKYWNNKRYCLDILMIMFIVFGTIHYIRYQRINYGKDFSWNKFFFVNSCSNKNPNPN